VPVVLAGVFEAFAGSTVASVSAGAEELVGETAGEAGEAQATRAKASIR
jgi:L-asparagine transporter-like permease